MYYLLMYF